MVTNDSVDTSKPALRPSGSIRQILAAMHKQWRRVLFWSGLTRFVLALIVSIAGLCVVDGLFQPVFLTRLLLVVIVMSVLGGFIWTTWLRYWIRPYSPKSMAWILESVFPDFHERLISAVELGGRGLHVKGISEALVYKALSEAEEEVHSLSPMAVFPMRWAIFRVPGVLLTVFLLAMLIPDLEAPQRLSRVLFPSPRDASLGSNQLVLYIGARVRDEGDTVYCRAYLKGGSKSKPELVVKIKETRRFLMEPEESKGWYSYALPDVKEDFTIWVSAGKVRSKTYTVSVRPRPKIKRIEMIVQSPQYTGAPVETLAGLSGDIRVLQGSQVAVRVHSTQKLLSFSVTHDGERISQQMGDLGDWVEFPLHVVKDGHYTLSMANVNGLRNQGDLTYSVKSLPDLPPEIHLNNPVKEQHVEMTEDLVLSWEAADDYGIASQSVLFRGAGNVVAYKLDLKPEKRDWNFIPEKCGMRPGMKLFLSLRVTDEAGQRTEAGPVKILLGGGKILDDLDVYLTLCDQLELTLSRIRNELQAVATYAKYLESFDNQTGGDPHYRLMLDRKVEIVREALQFSQTVTLAMMDRGTFPKSSHYAELLKLYQEQEMLFSLPELTKRSPEPALKRLNRMVNLEISMVQALKEKGHQHQWSVLLPLKINSIQSVQMDEKPEIMRERLSLIYAELSSDFKKQFRHFPDEEELVTLKVGDIFARSLSALHSAVVENRRQFANMRRLDRAATAIEKELRGLEKQLRGLADELKKGGSDQQWNEARDLAANYANIAAGETDPARRADMQLVADRLTAAVANRYPEGIAAAAEALTVLQVDNRMGQLKNRLKNAQLDGRMLECALTDSDLQSTDNEKEKLDALIRFLGDLETESNTLRELDHDDQLGTIAQAVKQARECMVEGNKALQPDQDISIVADQISQGNDTLEKVFAALSENESRRRQKADSVRSNLIQAGELNSERVGELAEVLHDAADDLSLPEAPIATVAEQLSEEAGNLKRLAEKFRDEAVRDLMLGRTSPERLLEKTALANALDYAREEQVTGAQEFLEQTATRLSDNPNQDTQYAADLLRQAGQRVADVARLARLHERADLGQASKRAAEESHAAIIRELKDVLPDNLQRVLETEQRFSENAVALKRITTSYPPNEVSGNHEAELNRLRQKVADDLKALSPDMLENVQGEAGAKAHQELTPLWEHSFETYQSTSPISDEFIQKMNKTLAESETFLREGAEAKAAMRNLEVMGQMFRDQATNTMAVALAAASEEQAKHIKQLSERFAKVTASKERRQLLAAAEKAFAGGSDMAANLHKARLGLGKMAEGQEQIGALRKIVSARKWQANQSVEGLESTLAEGDSSQLNDSRVSLAHLKANVENELFKPALKNLQAIKDTFADTARLADYYSSDDPEGVRLPPPLDSLVFPLQSNDGSPALSEGMKGLMALEKMAELEGFNQTDGNIKKAVQAFENAAVIARKVAVAAISGSGESGQGRVMPVLSAPEIPVEAEVGFRPWRGAGGGMSAGDMKGMVNRYDAYYRDANRVYLEKINREGRKWIE